MPWYRNRIGDQLWYEDKGAGPAIVLVHGWCMSSAVWRFQLESMSQSCRVIAPDLRGHGQSKIYSDGCNINDYVADIEDLYCYLDLGDTLLTGWSLGAQIVLQAVTQLRAKISGIGLISGTPRFTATDDFPWALGTIEADGMAVKVRRNMVRALAGFIERMFAHGEFQNPVLAAQIRDLLASIPLPEARIALQSLQALVSADMRRLLPAIDVPALIINGDRDFICLPGASDYMAQFLINCQHVVMPGCGHIPFLTRHTEFDQVLAGFRRRISDCCA